MRKIQCSGCGLHFANEGLFTAHRTGQFGKTGMKVGRSPRRCLSEEELEAKGWILHLLPIKYYRDGKPFLLDQPTWIKTEGLLRFESLSEKWKGQQIGL